MKDIRILTDSHSHEGQPVVKGVVLTGVDDATADHLIEIGAAELATSTKTRTPKE